MRLFPIVVSGLFAVSFSPLAAAQDSNKGPNVNVSPDVQNSQQSGASTSTQSQSSSSSK